MSHSMVVWVDSQLGLGEGEITVISTKDTVFTLYDSSQMICWLRVK